MTSESSEPSESGELSNEELGSDRAPGPTTAMIVDFNHMTMAVGYEQEEKVDSCYSSNSEGSNHD